MRDFVFRLVLIGISAIILYFEYQLFRGGRGRFGQRAWFRPAAILFWLYAANAKLPFLFMILLPREWLGFSFDGPLSYWYFGVLAWAYPMFLLGLGHGLVSLLAGAAVRSRALFRVGSEAGGSTEESSITDRIGRGELLRRAGSIVPVGLHLSLLGGMIAGSREFVAKNIKFPIADLHEDLRGFRVVQISDLHIGVLVSGRYLDLLADILIHEGGDLLVVTGDIIDNNNAFIPEAGRFFRRLSTHFPGMFGVLGNHDYIHDAEPVFGRLPLSGLELLRNRVVRIRRGTGILQILGMDYPGRRMGNSGERLRMAQAFYRETAAQVAPQWPTILLNHHPSDYSFLRRERIDLILSGHTHGGQIVFSDDRESPLAPASAFFPYYRGMYQEGPSRLYVSPGVGHWFPLRVNTPPEITVFELQRA